MKLEDLSFRQMTIGILLLSLVRWAFLQFFALPHMSQNERNGIYSGWVFKPYSYAVSLALIVVLFWFAFVYRGHHSTHGRRVAAFGMAFAGLCGMLIILAIRFTWHI